MSHEINDVLKFKEVIITSVVLLVMLLLAIITVSVSLQLEST